MGFHWQFGVVGQSTSSPLGISLNETEGEVLVAGLGGSSATSNAGEIDVTATASGGATPYSYAWTVTEDADRDGLWSVGAAGTQNAAQYNTLTLTCSSLPSPPNPPSEAEYTLECTVTDNNSDTAAATYSLVCTGIGL